MTVTADELDRAVATVVGTLGRATDRDWSALPGTGDLDCRATAEHLGDCLLSYAAQLVARPAGRYVRFEASVDAGASAAEVLEFAAAGGAILAATVRATPGGVRAFHPTGMADAEGFAGMGCVEVLLHGDDLARGLGLALDPPADLCARVLARMFPGVGPVDVDPWAALRWVTGRAALPDRPVRTDWVWRAAPIGE